MDIAEESQSFIPGGNVSPVSATRARRPLPQGPRIPNKPPQNQLTLTNLSPSSTPSSPSTSTSRLASPAPSFPPNVQAISSEPFPPSYEESPDKVDDPPFPVVPYRSSASSDLGIQAGPIHPVSSNPETKLAIKAVPKAVTLVPPPKINFESVPILFKGLPLEAAQWTFSSAELQDIVSRAIRLSARESFIRVLSIETLDKEIVNENERLATLKVMTQSQYRFQVHRRTMLLQALNSSASAIPYDPSTISSLAGQLSETTAQCDRLLEELLQVSDQQAQLAKVQDLHWASALAIALRKMNKSYERKVNDLRGAHDKIEVLEAELEEAWKEAEKVAQEIDNLKAAMSDEEDEDGEEGEDIAMHTAHMVGVTGMAVATTAKLMSSTEATEAPAPTPPSAPPAYVERPESRAARSDGNRSRRSSRERISRWSRVTAAKTRSRRTSNASLRVTKRSLSRAGRNSEDKLRPPPVPIIPGNLHESSFLEFDSKHTSMTREGEGEAYLDKPEERPHPFSTGTTTPEDVPSVWLLAESPPKAHPEDRDRVQSMRPFPRVRSDSAGRSSSEYGGWNSQRYSVPVPSYSSDPGTGTTRSETP